MSAGRATPGTSILLGALVLVAAALRVPGLDGPLWLDEVAALLKVVRRPLSEILTTFDGTNNHVLYSAMAHVSASLLGESPWALRLPAYLCGVASIPALYALGRVVTTPREALLSAALLSASYHHIWFSQDARGYTLMLCCALLTTAAMVAGVTGRRKNWVLAYVVAAAIGVYTHLTMAIVLAAQSLAALAYVFVTRRRRDAESPAPRAWPIALVFALSVAIGLAVYAPILPSIATRFAALVVDGVPFDVREYSFAFIDATRILRHGLGSVGLVVAVGLGAVGAWAYLLEKPFVFALFVLPVAGVEAAIARVGWPPSPRFFFFACGFAVLMIVRGSTVVAGWFASIAGASADTASRAAASTVGFLVLASVASLGRLYRLPKQDFEAAVRFVEAESARGSGEPILVTRTALANVSYLGRPWRPISSSNDFVEARSQGRRVWVVYTLPHVIDAFSPDIMAALRRDCVPVRTFPGTVGDGDVVVCVAPSL